MPLKRRTNKPQGSGKVALIDGDIIHYQSAAVCDVVNYHWNGHEPIHYKKDAVNYGHANGLNPDDLVKTVTPEPVEFCLHTIKSMIHSIMDATGADSARIFLTGKGNYRELIDSRYPYKGHRPPEKPTHFEAAREYLIKQFNAEVIDGAEADDAMGIAQYKDFYCNARFSIRNGFNKEPEDLNTIIATLDKDLNMIPGWHYNWQRDTLYWVDVDEADEFFYKQLLTGDNVDNIKGIKGVGPVKATSLLLEAATNKERYEICLAEYEKAGMDYYDLLENANLLWIQREPNQYWMPPL